MYKLNQTICPLNLIKTRYCQICLFECDDNVPTDFCTEEEKLVWESLKSITETSNCVKCDSLAHNLCIQSHSDKPTSEYECQKCKNTKFQEQPTCQICFSNDGQVIVLDAFTPCIAGHFICFYFSCRFALIEYRFVPYKSNEFTDQLPLTDTQPCQICSLSVSLNDSRFECRCLAASHIYCVLNQRIKAIVADNYNDTMEGKFPVFRMSVFSRRPVTFDLTSDEFESFLSCSNQKFDCEKDELRRFLNLQRQLNPSRAFSTSLVVFNMTCVNCVEYSRDSLFCCREVKTQDKIEFEMCSLCSLWIHKDSGSCCKMAKKDVALLKERTGGLASKCSRKKGRRGDDVRQRFFCCRNCFNLVVQSMFASNDCALLSHEHFITNLFLRLVASDNRSVDWQLFETLRTRFSKTHLLKLECSELQESMTRANKCTLGSSSGRIGVFDEFELLFVNDDFEHSDFVRIFEVARNLKEKTRLLSSRELSMNALEASYCKACDVLIELQNFIAKSSLKGTSKIKMIKRLTNEKLGGANLPFNSAFMRFLNNHVFTPLSVFSNQLGLVFEEQKIALHSQVERMSGKQGIETGDIVQFIASKIPLENLELIWRNFADNLFCAKYYAIIGEDDDSSSFESFAEFSDFSQFNESLKSLLHAKFVDLSKLDAMTQFVNAFFEFRDLDRIQAEIECGVGSLRVILSGKCFLEDFTNNMRVLVRLEKLINYNQRSRRFKNRNTDLKKMEQVSENWNDSFADCIVDWEMNPHEQELKKVIETVLNEVVSNQLAVSERVFEFISLHAHEVNLEQLINAKENITLPKFNELFGGIDEELVHHRYNYRIMRDEREKRERLNSKVEKLFAEPLRVCQFDDFEEMMDSLAKEASAVRQHHDQINLLQQNYSFWKVLHETVNELLVDDFLALTTSNVKLISSKLDNATFEQLLVLMKIRVDKFVVADLESLYDKSVALFWKLKIGQKTRIELSLIDRFSSASNLELIVREDRCITNEDINFTLKLLSECKTNEIETTQLCRQICRDDKMIDDAKAYCDRIDVVMMFYKAFKVDTQPIKQNLLSLFIFRVLLEILSRCNQFNRLCSSTNKENIKQSRNSAKETQSCRKIDKLRVRSDIATLRNSKQFFTLKRLNDIVSCIGTIKFFGKDHIASMFETFRNQYQVFIIANIRLDKVLKSLATGECSNDKCEFQSENELRAFLKTIDKFRHLLHPKLSTINSYILEFDENRKVLDRLVNQVLGMSIQEVKSSNLLVELEAAMRVLDDYKFNSVRVDESIAASELILNVFQCDEKQADIVKRELSALQEHVFSDQTKQSSFKLREDVSAFIERVEGLEQVLKSLQSKVHFESDFNHMIDDFTSFIADSPLQTSFTYSFYSEFIAEIEAIVDLQSNKFASYALMCRQSVPRIQLTENLSHKLEEYKVSAAHVNSFVQANIDKMTAKEKLELFLAVAESGVQLSVYHSEQVHQFIDEFKSHRRKLIEYKNRITSNYRNGKNNNEEVDSLDKLITALKCKELMSNFEAIELLLLRLFVELSPLESNSPFSFENVSVMAKMQLIVTMFDAKLRKNCRKIMEVVKEDVQSVFYMLFLRLSVSSNQLYLWNSANASIKEILAAFKKSFEKNKAKVKNEYQCFLRENEKSVSNREQQLVFPNRFALFDSHYEPTTLNSNLTESELSAQNEDIAYIEMIPFMQNDILENLNSIKVKKLQTYLRRVRESMATNLVCVNLSTELHERFMRLEMIEKNPSVVAKIRGLSEKLVQWIDAENGDIIKREDSNQCTTQLLKRTRVDIKATAKHQLKHTHLSKIALQSKSMANTRESVNDQSQPAKQLTKLELIDEYIRQLSQNPSMCKKLEKSNFAMAFVKKSIYNRNELHRNLSISSDFDQDSCNDSQTSKKKKNVSKPFAGAYSKPQISFGRKNCNDKLISKKVKIDESTKFTIRRVSRNLEVLIWQTDVVSFNCFDCLTNLEVLTTCCPEQCPISSKSVIYMHSSTCDSVINLISASAIETNDKQFRLEHCVSSIDFNNLIELILDQSRDGHSSHSTLFSAWFDLSTENGCLEENKKFLELLVIYREKNSVIKELLLFDGFKYQVFVGSARLISLKVAKWINISTLRSQRSHCIDDFWVIVIERQANKNYSASKRSCLTCAFNVKVKQEAKMTTAEWNCIAGVQNAPCILKELSESGKLLLKSKLL